jgi:hypothetical protein
LLGALVAAAAGKTAKAATKPIATETGVRIVLPHLSEHAALILPNSNRI